MCIVAGQRHRDTWHVRVTPECAWGPGSTLLLLFGQDAQKRPADLSMCLDRKALARGVALGLEDLTLRWRWHAVVAQKLSTNGIPSDRCVPSTLSPTFETQPRAHQARQLCAVVTLGLGRRGDAQDMHNETRGGALFQTDTPMPTPRNFFLCRSQAHPGYGSWQVVPHIKKTQLQKRRAVFVGENTLPAFPRMAQNPVRSQLKRVFWKIV